MKRHDLHIEIGRDGKVRLETEGMKGTSCLALAELLELVVGPTVFFVPSAECHEPAVRIDAAAGVETGLRLPGPGAGR